MMDKPLRNLLAAWALSLGTASAWCQGAAAPPPAELFFKGPAIQQAKLSPSGRWVAITAAIGGKRVGLLSLDLSDPGKSVKLAHFTDVDVGEFHWVGDERLVFKVFQDDRGSADQLWAPGLQSVSRAGGDIRTLVDADTSAVREHTTVKSSVLPFNHLLLDVPTAGTGNEVVVGEYHYDGRNLLSLQPKRLNVETGRSTLLTGVRVDDAKSWLFDTQGQPRVAVSVKEGRASLRWRDGKQPDWQLLAEFDDLHWPYKPVHVDDQGDLLVLESSGPGGVDVLKRFDMQAKRPAAHSLVSAPGFSVGSELAVDGRTGRLLGVHVDTDAYSAVWFDPRLKALQAEADKRWPDRVNKLSCVRCLEPDMVALLHSWSDRDPGQFWVYRLLDKSWQKLGDSRPDVDARRMATLDFHRIKARDGKDLPLWLTLPAGHKKGDRPPAVVLVHGGPWVRGGHWAWDPMAQFLASRGYAVIEPEYRGSTGFGGVHFRAGWKQWGTTMQDDVADALEWARQQGHVSANRACIAGASYGGYAALMGPLRHPELYRCAIAWVAVTDPLLRMKWSAMSDLSDESRAFSLPQLIGDPVADLPMLKAASPLERAGELKLPLLLGFGADDRRVPLEHGTRLRAALKAQGRDPEWVVYPGEGHGGWTLEHKLDWAGRMERFLAQHLK